MKYVLLTIFMCWSVASKAQTQKEIETFSKEYFAHFQKKDFDWIMVHYATQFELKEHYLKYNWTKEFDEDEFTAEYEKMRTNYLHSLKSQYERWAVVPKSKFLKVAKGDMLFANDQKSVQIVFAVANSQPCYIYPGPFIKTNAGHVSFYGNRMHTNYYSEQKAKQTVRGNTTMDLAAPVIGKPRARSHNLSENDIASPEMQPPVSVDRVSDEKMTQKELDNKVYAFADQLPEFLGGKNELLSFLKENIQVPSEDVEGKVYVSFTVNANGTLEDFKILRNLCNTCGNEAIRVLKKMPPWIPGKQNGKVVRCLFTLAIEFNSSK